MSEKEDNTKGSSEEISSDELSSMINGSGADTGSAGDNAESCDEGYATLQKPVTNGTSGKDETEKVPARKLSLTLSTMDTDDRRSDEPTKLSFEKGMYKIPI